MKRFAVVTGASSGIGLQYARTLAHEYQYNILLVSNQEKELADAAAAITAEFGVETRTLCLNLAESTAANQVYDYCKQNGLDVEVLINDAGMLIFQPLLSTPEAKLETMLMLHMVTLTKLCRLFAADMAAKGLTMHNAQCTMSVDNAQCTVDNGASEHSDICTMRGYILNMSSMTAWMAMPGIQCYNATKGYVLNFSRAFWYEMQRERVHVLAVTPGSTDTGLLPFTPGFAKLLRLVGITMSPERLVKRALKVLFTTRRKRCMPGAWNYIIVPIINHLPDWVVFAAMKRIPAFSEERGAISV